MPRRIFRNCIKEGSHLSFYLKNLVDIGILEREKDDDGKYRYVQYYPYSLFPVDSLCKNMKDISPLALDFIFTGDPNIGNLDIDEYCTFFQPYFIGIPESFFNPQGEFKKEFEETFKKFEEGIMALGKFLRENTPANQKIGHEFPCFECSHRYGIYINLNLLSDVGLRTVRESPRYDEEENE